LTRQQRIEFEDATYHVFSHAVDETALFLDDVDRRCFLDYIQELVGLGMLIVHAFVLMITHFHLLCQTPEAGLSKHLRKLLGKYAQSFNGRHARNGHLLRARYKALLVEDGDYFLECSRYIHLNPVRAYVCSDPGDYRWSSYRHYLQPTEELDWVTTARTLESFPSKMDYAQFVLQACAHQSRDPFREAYGNLVFGSKDFAERMGLRVSARKAAHSERSREFRNRPELSFGAIDRAVAETFPGLSKCQHDRMVVYAMQRFTAKTGKEIASITDRDPSEITQIWKVLQGRLLNDCELRQRMDLLMQLLQVK